VLTPQYPYRVLVHVDPCGASYSDGLVIRSERQTLIAAFNDRRIQGYPHYEETAEEWLRRFVPPEVQELSLAELASMFVTICRYRRRGEPMARFILYHRHPTGLRIIRPL